VTHRKPAAAVRWKHCDGERRRAWCEQRFLPTLEALTRLDVERVLVTQTASRCCATAPRAPASLERPPWSRSSLY
jgi:hypothetical protein